MPDRWSYHPCNHLTGLHHPPNVARVASYKGTGCDSEKMVGAKCRFPDHLAGRQRVGLLSNIFVLVWRLCA